MTETRTSLPLSSLRPLLLLVPSALFAPFLVPGLGDYGEGLWPEWFAFEQKGSLDFGSLATTITVWSVGTLVVAIVIAAALHAWTVWSWRSKLRAFDVEAVTDYKRFVWWHVLIAFLASSIAAVFALLLSESLREAAEVSWVIFVTAVGVFGALQLMAMIWGLRPTFVLYRGR